MSKIDNNQSYLVKTQKTIILEPISGSGLKISPVPAGIGTEHIFSVRRFRLRAKWTGSGGSGSGSTTLSISMQIISSARINFNKSSKNF